MLVNQTSTVSHGYEVDLLAEDKFKDRPEKIPTGSSFSRRKTSLSKVVINDELSKEKNRFSEKMSCSSVSDNCDNSNTVPNNGLFERDQPLQKLGLHERRGFLSKRSKRKIINKCLAWNRSERNHRNRLFSFLTTTLTSKQIGGAREYNKMLNVFLTYLRKYCGVKNYLWVNERQKNGNLHTHIIVDIFVPMMKAKIEWCRILRDNGYDADHNGAAWNFTKGGIHLPQRSTHVEKVESEVNLTHYLTKYITKNESNIDGLIWNCSNSISQLVTGMQFWSKEAYSALVDCSAKEFSMKLTDGSVMYVNLFHQMPDIVRSWFNINNEIIRGKMDREKFLERTKCKFKAQLPG